MLGLPRLYLIAGGAVAVIAALGAFALWNRSDAVSELLLKQEAERVEHIKDARKIENEVRNLDDDAILDCLLGRKC